MVAFFIKIKKYADHWHSQSLTTDVFFTDIRDLQELPLFVCSQAIYEYIKNYVLI